jgi:hypothetical protein
MDIDPEDEGWRQIGGELVQRFNAVKAWDRALEVGLKIAGVEGRESRDDRLARSMVVAAYKSGREGMAVGFLEKLAVNVAPAARAPAMTATGDLTDFDKVVRDLEARKKGTP